VGVEKPPRTWHEFKLGTIRELAVGEIVALDTCDSVFELGGWHTVHGQRLHLCGQVRFVMGGTDRLI
jgi:hypothetical protein